MEGAEKHAHCVDSARNWSRTVTQTWHRKRWSNPSASFAWGYLHSISRARRGTMTETESRPYRGRTSTYHAALRELGMEATPSPEATVATAGHVAPRCPHRSRPRALGAPRAARRPAQRSQAM